MGRQIGDNLVDLGRLAFAAWNRDYAALAVDMPPSDLFGSDNTNAGLFGADMAPAAELALPIVRANYLKNLSQIPTTSARVANAMRNELKWGRKKTFEELVEEGKSEADIIESARRSNFGVNAAAATTAGGVAALSLGCN